MNNAERKKIEAFARQSMGHTADDWDVTTFLKKHGFGPTGVKRGRTSRKKGKPG